MSKWKTVKLGDVCEIISGSTPKTNIYDYWDGEYCWITPAELSENSDVIYDTERKITDKGAKSCSLTLMPIGTVLLSSRAPIGKVAITGIEMYCNQGFRNFFCTDIIFNRYLYWFFKSNTLLLNSLGRGSTFKEISKSIVSDIKIPLPPVEEQKKIASTLDKATHTINLCNQIIERLDLLIKAKFAEMFGDLGTNKFGWGLSKIGDISEINPKKAKDKRLKSDLEVSFVPMTAVSEKGDIDTSEIKKYDEVKKGFTYFAENDVLFAKITPCMENGKGCIANNLYNGIGFGSTEFHVLRPSEKINSCWLYTVTILEQFRKDACSNMTGSAGQKRVPAKFLENYEVTVPPIELQEKFADFVEQVNKSKSAVKQVLEKAETLKKSLMQEYFR